MEILLNWNVLGTIAAILLIIFFSTRNAVWGGFTAGLVIGLILVAISVFRENGAEWVLLAKSAIIGALMGGVIEIFARLSSFFSKKT